MSTDVIGHISVADGNATLVTANGETRPLAVGTEIRMHDQIATADGSTVEITFIDGTKFAAAPGSEFEINKVVYDPQGSDNGLIITFFQGGFEFVAGKIAPLFGDGMRVDTPAGSLGVRGTAGAAVQDPNTGQWTFMLLKDPNGHLGKIALINAQGQVLLDEWMESSRMGRDDEAPTRTQIMSTAQVRDVFGSISTMIQSLGDQTTHPDAPQVPQPGNPPPSSADPTQGSDAGHLGLTPFEQALLIDGALSEIAAAAEETAAASGVLEDTDGEALDPNDIFNDLGDNRLIFMPVYADDGTWTGTRAISGTEGPDNTSGTAGPDVANLLGGDDIFNAGSGNDTVNAGIGNDVIHGGDGADAISGDQGNDELFGDAGNDTLNGGDGDDRILDGDGFDVVHGDLGADRLEDGAGDDQLFGDSGDDMIISGSGANMIDGGDGIDTASYENHGPMVIDLAAGTAKDLSTGDIDTLTSIEAITGSNNADIIDTRGAAAATVSSGLGDDQVTADADATIALGLGDDTVTMAAPAGGAIHGGDGFDTWVLTTQILDLGGLSVDGINNIDLGSVTGASITLKASDILDIADGNELYITGDADDTVALLSDEWNSVGPHTRNGVNYTVFESTAGQILYIDQEVTANLS